MFFWLPLVNHECSTIISYGESHMSATLLHCESSEEAELVKKKKMKLSKSVYLKPLYV